MTTISALREITLAAYLALPETVQPQEIIEGEIRGMPGPLPEHQRVTHKAARALEDSVERSGVGEVFQSPLDLLIREAPLTIRQPDLFAVATAELTRHPGYRKTLPLRARPFLVVEVHSPGNSPREVAERLADYASLGVEEVWLVFVEAQRVEVLRLEAGAYVAAGVYQAQERLVSSAVPDLTLLVGDLFE